MKLSLKNNKPNIKPLKSLGQNFLVDENIVDKIVDSLNIQNNDTILEIGPGTGALTRKIAKYDNPLLLVEIDERSVNYLKKQFEDRKNIKIIPIDFLKFNFNDLKLENIKIIGNLPYYITSQILFKISEHSSMIDECVFTVQKEVAERITAKPGNKDYGFLTVVVNYFSEAEKLFNIKPGAFSPPPKVMSSVINLKIKKDIPNNSDKDNFFKFVKAAFSTRRKKLSNSLKSYISTNCKYDKNKLLKKDKENFNYLSKRAEQLSLQDFINLYKLIKFEINNY